MSDQAGSGSAEKKSIGAELIIPVSGLIFTFYYFYTIIDVPRIAQISAFFVGTILIFLTIIFIIRSIREVNSGVGDYSFRRLIEPVEFANKRLALAALTIGYIVAVPQLGFTITTFLFIALAMLLLGGGQKVKLILSLSLILSVGGFFLFIVVFKTRFPEGPFERFMKPILEKYFEGGIF